MARLLALRLGTEAGNHNQFTGILAGIMRSGPSFYYCLDIEPEIS
jgi:hypothetical protein